MAYEIIKSDGTTKLVTLLDGEVDSTSSDLTLLGKNYLGYGEIIAKNFVHLLENFAGKNRADLAPIAGEVWFNSDTKGLEFNIDSGTTDNSWKRVTAFSYGTGVDESDIVDTAGAKHKCIRIWIADTLVAVISTAGDFTPAAFGLQPDNFNYSTFLGTPRAGAESDFNGQIGKGINLNNSSSFKLRGVAVEAEFADVAEIYVGDASYEPGTLVSLGGAAEVTQTTEYADTDIFGIVSTRPAYLMNSRRKGEKNALPIAVAGRIPVKIKGTVNRGDRLVSSDEPGVAQAATGNEPAWCIVGRSLGHYSGSGVGKVEATIGVR